MNHPYRSHAYQHQLPTRRRVVVTGLGAISALGIGVQPFWQSLLEGRSGIGTITRFNTEGMTSTIAGEVKDFDPVRLIEPRLKPKRLSRQAQFAIVAAAEAVQDAGLNRKFFRSKRIGVVVGSSIASLDSVTGSALQIQEKGAWNGNAAAVAMGNLQSSAIAVGESLEIEDLMAMGLSNACVSGIDAVKTACDLIRVGRFDTVICGGTDAPISLTPMAEFVILGLNSRRNEEPERASRPFDRERDTGVLSEGCGIMVVESRESALERGAAPYLEIVGEHSNIDPEKDRPGGGLEGTMRGAMENAGCKMQEVDYISAWGSGHPMLDRFEIESIKRVFGAHSRQLAVSSIKGAVGNPLAAAGALQLIASSLSYRHQMLPPTANYEYGELDCDLDIISRRPRRIRLRHSLINSHGLGGGNTSMALAPG
jgi:3-oxoacyl-[acyl-carrier-protein] synthase II